VPRIVLTVPRLANSFFRGWRKYLWRRWGTGWMRKTLPPSCTDPEAVPVPVLGAGTCTVTVSILIYIELEAIKFDFSTSIIFKAPIFVCININYFKFD
jgi:hypothetical protein